MRIPSPFLVSISCVSFALAISWPWTWQGLAFAIMGGAASTALGNRIDASTKPQETPTP